MIDSLQSLAQELLSEADAFRPGLLSPGVREVPRRLDAGRLTLAVLGQFKRGKSTLINALLGAPAMPTSVLPLTSVVTFVRHGSRPRLSIQFRDEREEDHPPDALASYVTEEFNPRNAKGVAAARLEWPSAFLDRPIRVVDTPGVGSVYGHNTQASEAFLDHLDAAVFVLGVDPVLTETELAWLTKVKDRAERFFFVLNKTDHLSPEEVRQVIRFTHARLREIWGVEGKVYPLSARDALADPADPRFEAFRRDLLAFLDREGRQTLLRSARRKLQGGVRELLAAIALERAASLRPLAELEERLCALEEEEERIGRERSRGFWVLDDAQARVLSGLRRLCDDRWEKAAAEVRASLERAWEGSPTLGKARANAADALEGRLEELFGPLREAAEEMGCGQFDEAVAYLAREYEDLSARLTRAAGEWFGVVPCAVALDVPESRRSRFYVWVPRELAGLSSAGGSLVNLLPRAWGASLARRAFLEKADFFFEMQRDRLLTDVGDRFQARSGAAVAGLLEATDSGVRRIREAIASGVALHGKSRADRDGALERLAEREARVRDLASRLAVSDGAGTLDACGGAAPSQRVVATEGVAP